MVCFLDGLLFKIDKHGIFSELIIIKEMVYFQEQNPDCFGANISALGHE
jgi:hypothetical protein